MGGASDHLARTVAAEAMRWGRPGDGADDSVYDLASGEGRIPMSAHLSTDDVVRLIHTPHTRIQDKADLVRMARIAFDDHRHHPELAAGCVCAIGYRALEAFEPDHPDLDFVLEHAPKLITELDTKDGLGYCWFVSLHLLLAYTYLIREARYTALLHLKAIIAARENLPHFPSMVTNTLKAILMAARFTGVERIAIYATLAVSTLKTYMPAFPLNNTWAFNELSQSIALAQASFALEAQIERERNGTPNLSIGPVDLAPEFECLGFPGLNLIQRGLL